MAKEKKTNQSNGKGDRNRVSNKKRFDKNWDKIFEKKLEPTGSINSNQLDNNIKKVWSSEDCKIDKNGGPYKVEIKND